MRAHLGLAATLLVLGMGSCTSDLTKQVERGQERHLDAGQSPMNSSMTDAHGADGASVSPMMHHDAGLSEGGLTSADGTIGFDAASDGASRPANDSVFVSPENCVHTSVVQLADGSVITGPGGEGVQVNAWGTALCLDLSGATAYPGACSMEMTEPDGGGDGGTVTAAKCEYSYTAQDRLASYACNTLIYDSDSVSTTLSYSGSVLVTVFVDAFTEPDETTDQFSLPSNSLTHCDYRHVCNSTSLTDEEERDFLELYVPQFSAPQVNAARRESGQVCTTSGSIADGEIVQRCADHDYRFVYAADGTLVLRIVHTHYAVGLAPYGSPDRAFAYDVAGNLRYAVDLDGAVTTYNYDCW